jgi:hypothetical protein
MLNLTLKDLRLLRQSAATEASRRIVDQLADVKISAACGRKRRWPGRDVPKQAKQRSKNLV